MASCHECLCNHLQNHLQNRIATENRTEKIVIDFRFLEAIFSCRKLHSKTYVWCEFEEEMSNTIAYSSFFSLSLFLSLSLEEFLLSP